MDTQPKPKRAKICPYCGKSVEELTKDHIVSRGLFVPPYPDNLLTVRVCYPCNQEKGLNEDYLRDFLILHIEAAHSATARILKETTLVRAILDEEHGNTSKIAEALTTRGQLSERTTPNGMEEVYVVPIEIERRDAVLRAMVKGLNFKKFREILPGDHTIDVVWIAVDKVAETQRAFTQRGALVKSLGEVFSYQCLSTEDKHITFWLFLFYESILFQIATYPPEYTPPVHNSEVKMSPQFGTFKQAQRVQHPGAEQQELGLSTG